MAGVGVEDQVHVDPDAQATVTDFIDYTEHLPSDIRRSLALIDKLNESIINCQDKVHYLTKTWNNRVTAVGDASAEEIARVLRAKISYQKDLSSKYAAAALAEAQRIDKEVARHQNLISVTGVKLDALPLPPSRDPSPQPQSPQATRAAGQTGPRIKLRIENNRLSAHTTRPDGTAPRSRKRRILVPGEVLPPPNPNSPSPSEMSDWESPSPPLRLSLRPDAASRVHKPVRIRPPKPPKPPKPEGEKAPQKARPPRPAGVMGTNVHSSVAGISTSNALMLLTPPPNNATPGSQHAPWMRLTEYEMAKLRKRMKKNAIWAPSDTMIRRELNDAGRGPENYRKARQLADETGKEFVDVDDLMNKDNTRELQPGEIHLDDKTRRFNKGMSLNVQKKAKQARLQKELAEQAKLEAEQAAKNLGDLGNAFKTLFDRPSSIDKDKPPVKTPARKRRREQSMAVNEESLLHSQLHAEMVSTPTTAAASKPAKRRRPNASTTPQASTTPTSVIAPPASVAVTTTSMTNSITTTVPLAAPAPSPIKASAPNPPSQPTSPTASRRPETRRLSLVVRPPHDPNTTNTAQSTTAMTSSMPAGPPSRPSSRRASAGPPSAGFGNSHSRRKSATPGPAPPVPTLASSRSKRPAPGPVTNSQEGGNAISVGKRQKRPIGKKGSAAAASAAKRSAEGASAGAVGDGQDLEEEIDPNEPRYCVCGDVSYGTMVMCENPDCEKEWFHLECVGLADIPSRRAKWWCPDCSLKLGKKGEAKKEKEIKKEK